MPALRFSEGPKRFGCVYHRRAVHVFSGDDLVVDVFVMPAIQDDRPIALTIGRYRDGEAIMPKEKTGFEDASEAGGSARGNLLDVRPSWVDAALGAYMADDVDQFLVREAEAIRMAMVNGR